MAKDTGYTKEDKKARKLGKVVKNYGGKKVMPDNPFYKEIEDAWREYRSRSDSTSLSDTEKTRYKERYENAKAKGLKWEREHTSWRENRRVEYTSKNKKNEK